jgi:hypothetical protein
MVWYLRITEHWVSESTVRSNLALLGRILKKRWIRNFERPVVESTFF